MRTAAIELNDAEIAGVGAGGDLVFTEPGCALVEGAGAAFGRHALASARLRPNAFFDRYWHEMSDEPMPRAAAEFATPADLVHAHLGALVSRFGDESLEFVLAVPGHWEKSQLGLLLGLADEHGLPIRALVDAPVASVRRQYVDSDLWHLDSATHAMIITRIEQDGRVSRGERHILEGIGLDALERACVNHIGQAFLDQARFDPLHDAACEQQVYDSLYAWLTQLARQESAALEIEFSGNVFGATVTRAGLTEAVGRSMEPLMQRLRSLLPPGQTIALQIASRLADLPGVIPLLSGLQDCHVFVQEPGAAALGAQRRIAALPDQGGYRLVTSLPWDQPAQSVDADTTRGTVKSGSVAPSHVLHRGQAYRIGARSFTVGSELAAGEYGLNPGNEHSGISRRHCTLEAAEGRVLLHDHSRFGTWLNGFKVDSSAVLQPGDVISAGTPPCELTMIVEVEPDG